MTAVGKNLFERLGKGQPQPEEAIEQQRKGAKRVARGIQAANARAFLMDVLANGPVPAIIIKELGAARGFNAKQLWHAKQQIRAGSFKAKGKWAGCWFWTLTQHTPERAIATKSDERHTRRLRDLSKALGFRLRPIGNYSRGKNNRGT
jgi:hypothetical protein